MPSIQQIIDEKLGAEQELRRERIRSGKMNPSALGYCFRRQYWNRLNEVETNPPDARSLRVFSAGKLFEDWVAKYVFGVEIARQVELETEDLKGYADFAEVNVDEITEIKSVHSRQFWHTKKETYDVNKEKIHNILQLMVAVWILKKSTGRLVFISKDDLCIDEYLFDLKDWKDQILDELNKNRIFWTAQMLPPASPRLWGRDKEGHAKECQWCCFRDKDSECRKARLGK